MEEPFLAEVRLFAFKFAPVGWAPCDGRLLAVGQNVALFSVLGSAYGGDGKTIFALPNYGSVAPAGLQYCIALQGVYPQNGGGYPSVGELATLPYGFAPPGWMTCAGQLLSVTEFDTLAQVLGTRFGGDGETTFGLPNLTATPPPPSPLAGAGSSLYFISLFGSYGPPSSLLGTVQLMPFESVPFGWLACDGQLLQIIQHQALFSLLGITFGGDGRTTFGLPDLQQLGVPAGTQYCICANAPFPRSAAEGPAGANAGDANPPAEEGSA